MRMSMELRPPGRHRRSRRSAYDCGPGGGLVADSAASPTVPAGFSMQDNSQAAFDGISRKPICVCLANDTATSWYQNTADQR